MSPLYWLLLLPLLASEEKKTATPTKKGKGKVSVLQWLPQMKAAKAKYPSVPLSLACAIMENESGGSPTATRYECRGPNGNFGGRKPCPVGTQRLDAKGRPLMSTGLWQFLIATGEAYGLRATLDPSTDERLDPDKSTMAAFRFLSELLRAFPGSESSAIAAYNAGTGGVRSYQKRHPGGVPNQPYVDHINAKREKYRGLDG